MTRRVLLLAVPFVAAMLLNASSASAEDGILISGITDTFCWAAATDADSDGLDDNCEYKLAFWFGPKMWFDSSENGSGRRPYFAAKSYSYSSRKIQIMEMFTYYNDTGIAGCQLLGGHDGDPEFNIYEVHYSTTTGRWYMDWTYMSQHKESWCDSSKWYYYSSLSYASTYRSWPVVYVSQYKHATYNNIANCQVGCEDWDDCNAGWSEGIGTLSGRNIGRSGDKLIDSVYYNGQYEYMWDDDFAGWEDGIWANSNGYYQHLSQFSF